MFTSIKKGSFTGNIRASLLPVLLIAIALIALSACGDAATPTTAPAPTAAAASNPDTASGGTAVQATLKEWAIALSSTSVPAGPVTFTVTNAGTMGHNFTVLDPTGNVVGATSTFMPSDGNQTLSVTLAAGTYTVICSLPGHATRGQMAMLTVK